MLFSDLKVIINESRDAVCCLFAFVRRRDECMTRRAGMKFEEKQ